MCAIKALRIGIVQDTCGTSPGVAVWLLQMPDLSRIVCCFGVCQMDLFFAGSFVSI